MEFSLIIGLSTKGGGRESRDTKETSVEISTSKSSLVKRETRGSSTRVGHIRLPAVEGGGCGNRPLPSRFTAPSPRVPSRKQENYSPKSYLRLRRASQRLLFRITERNKSQSILEELQSRGVEIVTPYRWSHQ